ncbi:unnamed protein product, partial [marine sediment metagenome]
YNCPVCGVEPEWDAWDTCVPQVPVLHALVCGNGGHQLRTTYFKDKKDSIIQWNQLVLDWR